MIITRKESVPGTWLWFAALPFGALTLALRVLMIENGFIGFWATNLVGFCLLLASATLGALMQDRTWTRFGRRKPFCVTGFLIGALCFALMPFVQEWHGTLLFFQYLAMGLALGYLPLVMDTAPVPQRGRATAALLIMAALAGLFLQVVFYSQPRAVWLGGLNRAEAMELTAALALLMAALWTMLGIKELPIPKMEVAAWSSRPRRKWLRAETVALLRGCVDREMRPVWLLVALVALMPPDWVFLSPHPGDAGPIAGLLLVVPIAFFGAWLARRFDRLRACLWVLLAGVLPAVLLFLPGVASGRLAGVLNYLEHVPALLVYFLAYAAVWDYVPRRRYGSVLAVIVTGFPLLLVVVPILYIPVQTVADRVSALDYPEFTPTPRDMLIPADALPTAEPLAAVRVRVPTHRYPGEIDLIALRHGMRGREPGFVSIDALSADADAPGGLEFILAGERWSGVPPAMIEQRLMPPLHAIPAGLMARHYHPTLAEAFLNAFGIYRNIRPDEMAPHVRDLLIGLEWSAATVEPLDGRRLRVELDARPDTAMLRQLEHLTDGYDTHARAVAVRGADACDVLVVFGSEQSPEALDERISYKAKQIAWTLAGKPIAPGVTAGQLDEADLAAHRKARALAGAVFYLAGAGIVCLLLRQERKGQVVRLGVMEFKSDLRAESSAITHETLRERVLLRLRRGEGPPPPRTLPGRRYRPRQTLAKLLLALCGLVLAHAGFWQIRMPLVLLFSGNAALADVARITEVHPDGTETGGDAPQPMATGAFWGSSRTTYDHYVTLGSSRGGTATLSRLNLSSTGSPLFKRGQALRIVHAPGDTSRCWAVFDPQTWLPGLSLMGVGLLFMATMLQLALWSRTRITVPRERSAGGKQC